MLLYTTECCLGQYSYNVLVIIKLKVSFNNVFTSSKFVEISSYQVSWLQVPLTTKWFLVNKSTLFCSCFVQVGTKCVHVYKKIMEKLLKTCYPEKLHFCSYNLMVLR